MCPSACVDTECLQAQGETDADRGGEIALASVSIAVVDREGHGPRG